MGVSVLNLPVTMSLLLLLLSPVISMHLGFKVGEKGESQIKGKLSFSFPGWRKPEINNYIMDFVIVLFLIRTDTSTALSMGQSTSLPTSSVCKTKQKLYRTSFTLLKVFIYWELYINIFHARKLSNSRGNRTFSGFKKMTSHFGGSRS